MNFIKNLYEITVGTIYSYITSYYSKPIENNPEELMQDYTIINHDNLSNRDYHYIFINTSNIYNATELMISRLKNDSYFYNKQIKIYLLKSHTLKPLFNNEYIIVNDKNIKKIHEKLKSHRRHLHTFIDAIESFIEFNNLHNYSIFY